MNAKIFISYSTIDLEAASRAKRVLDTAGHTAYVAEYNALGGVRLPDNIKLNISTCDIFVVLWSQHAKASDWVTQEIGFAESQSKVIVPIILQPDLRPGGFLNDRKYVSAATDFEKAMLELKIIVSEALKEKREAAGRAFLAISALGLLLAALSSK